MSTLLIVLLVLFLVGGGGGVGILSLARVAPAGHLTGSTKPGCRWSCVALL